MKTVEKSINGESYEITPFMGLHGWKLQAKLAKILAPSIRDALGALPKGKVNDLMKTEIDTGALGGAIGSFLDAIATDDPNGELVAELLSQTQRNGVLLGKNVINDVYAANYSEMVKALIAVVTANDFFGVSSFGLGEAMQKIAV